MPRAPSQLLRDALGLAAATLVLLGLLEAGCRVAGVGAPERIALPPKPPGSFRILALGESTVLGVPEGEYGFVSFLAHELPRMASGRALDLRNLARSGEGSAFVRRTLEQTIDGADLVIVLMGHNEFLVADRTRGWRGALWRLRESSWLVRGLAHATGRDAVAVEPPLPEHIEPVWPGSAYARDVLDGFQRNLDAIVALARARGVPLILCTAPSNVADWPPASLRVARPRADDFARAAQAVRSLLAAGRPGEARAEASAARARLGDDALLLYLEARALRAEGGADEARPLFGRARDLDLVPRRASDEINEAVRKAAGPPGVHLVDAVRILEADAPDGLVGFEEIGDNCHPTPRGHALIGRAIAASMADAGILLSRGAAIGSVEEWLARLDRRLGDEPARLRTRARWLLSNALYAMKTPFFNFEAARRYLDEVRRIAPSDWRVWANLATLSLLDGDVKSGRLELFRATRLRGAPLDPGERGNVPYLAEALSQSGVELPGPSAGGS
jgi:lysophospholipase L1-like esterase